MVDEQIEEIGKYERGGGDMRRGYARYAAARLGMQVNPESATPDTSGCVGWRA